MMETSEIKSQFDQLFQDYATRGENPDRLMILEKVLRANDFFKPMFLEEGTWLTPEEADEWKTYKDSHRYSDLDALLGVDRPSLPRPELKGFSIHVLLHVLTRPEVEPEIEAVLAEMSHSSVTASEQRTIERQERDLLRFVLQNLGCKAVADENHSVWFGDNWVLNQEWIFEDLWITPSEIKKMRDHSVLQYSMDEEVAKFLERPEIGVFSFTLLKAKIFSLFS